MQRSIGLDIRRTRCRQRRNKPAAVFARQRRGAFRLYE